jgi:hypothetical protein
MTETVRYSLLGKQDLRIGNGTFETVLGDGRVVTMDELRLSDLFTALTAGSVLFAGTAGIVAQDNTNLYWDSSNKRLGVGANAPVVGSKIFVSFADATTIDPNLTTGTFGLELVNTSTTANTLSRLTFIHGAGNLSTISSKLIGNNSTTSLLFSTQDAAGARAVLFGLIGPNIGIGTEVAFGGGVGVIGFNNSTTVPTSNAATGGILYVESGNLKWRGSGGTTTTIAAA